MAAPSNGVHNLLDDKNSFTNGNMSPDQPVTNLGAKIGGKKLIIPDTSSIDCCGNDTNPSTSDSDSVIVSSDNVNSSKDNDPSEIKVESQDNITCGSSEGYSIINEDLSGFEGDPISIKITTADTHEGASDDDEYFEEFHLPNSHENAFVRHRSFRKKVQLTPINAPDAARIEGLVRTGSFHRHDSVRRKILHEEPESDLDDSDSVTSLSEQLQQDIDEIEQIILSESHMNSNASNGDGKISITNSTPISGNTRKEVDSMNSLEFSSVEATEDSSLLLEQNTLKKIRECMDTSRHKSIYHLSGRLQDILTPQEIEEVLNNSEKYCSYLTAEVLEALSMSLHEATVSDEESEANASANGAGLTGKSGEVYKSCSSSLDLKVIQAPMLNLNTMEDSESIEVSDNESANTTEFISSSDMLEDSVDLTKNQRKISVEGVSFTSVSCYSAPSAESEQHALPEGTFPVGYPSPFSSPQTDLPIPPPPDLIPEADDVLEENHWRNVVIAGNWKRIDMKATQPYKSFISHGGFSDTGSQVIVISAPLLPKKSLKEYNYIMDNLFMYALSMLEQLVSEDYVLVYFAGGRATSGPGLHWMRRAYDMIDRRIRKNLKQLLIIHPSLWARTLVILSKPFISSKFYRKLRFIYSLTDLAQVVPLTNLQIPEVIKQLDFELMIHEKKRSKHNR